MQYVDQNLSCLSPTINYADSYRSTHTQADIWWLLSPGCRLSKEAIPSLDDRLIKKLLHLYQEGLQMLMETITGHC